MGDFSNRASAASEQRKGHTAAVTVHRRWRTVGGGPRRCTGIRGPGTKYRSLVTRRGGATQQSDVIHESERYPELYEDTLQNRAAVRHIQLTVNQQHNTYVAHPQRRRSIYRSSLVWHMPITHGARAASRLRVGSRLWGCEASTVACIYQDLY